MTLETETTVLTYFFKKSLCGMVLYRRVVLKGNERESTVTKCNEEQAAYFLSKLKEQKHNG